MWEWQCWGQLADTDKAELNAFYHWWGSDALRLYLWRRCPLTVSGWEYI